MSRFLSFARCCCCCCFRVNVLISSKKNSLLFWVVKNCDADVVQDALLMVDLAKSKMRMRRKRETYVCAIVVIIIIVAHNIAIMKERTSAN